MKSNEKLRSEFDSWYGDTPPQPSLWWLTFWTVVAFTLLFIGGGCAPTITPKAAHDAAPTYDGTQRNSGFLGFDSVGNGIITIRAYQRYMDLMDHYGMKFTQKLTNLTDVPVYSGTNTYIITPQELTYFATMSRWKKGQAP